MPEPAMLTRTSSSPATFAGLDLSEPRLMGILNVTPDSFSDGGRHFDQEAAIAHGRKLLAEGADIIDIGGESTRPGAAPVDVEAEMERVIPVISALKSEGVPLSIDSRRTGVMAAALDAGVRMINDVSGMADKEARRLAADYDCGVVIMHMKGTPETMQQEADYIDVVEEVIAFLSQRAEDCVAAGIKEENIAVDPGIGFGKTVNHNIALLRTLDRLQKETGRPVLVGASRKSFIGRLSEKAPVDQRLAGSLASVIAAYAQGVRLFRVHDVAETRQALSVWRALDG